MPHFKAFDLMNMQYEIRICQKILNKATNDKNQHPPLPFEHTAPLPYTLWSGVWFLVTGLSNEKNIIFLFEENIADFLHSTPSKKKENLKKCLTNCFESCKPLVIKSVDKYEKKHIKP